jgi:hypothetical protein
VQEAEEGLEAEEAEVQKVIRAVACAAGALALLGGGCGEESAQDAGGAFVGAVAGSDAYVAVLSDGDEVFGYLCDGERVSVWLERSPVEDGRAELVGRGGKRLGEVGFEDAGASGEIRVGGGTLAFAAEPAEGDAGLYREAAGSPGEPGFAETGWIVLAGGTVRGAKTKFSESGTDFVVGPAPPRGPGAKKLTPSFIESGSDI